MAEEAQDQYLIITLEEAFDHLKIARDTQSETTVLMWLREITRAIEEEIGRKVAVRSYEEILDGDGSSRLYVRNVPVVALVGADDVTKLANLQSRSDATSAWEDITDDIDQIFIDAVRPAYFIELLDGLYFEVGQKNVRVNYTAGYETIPGRIRLVCFEMMQFAYQKYRFNTLGKQSQNEQGAGGMGGATISYAHAELNNEHRRMLMPFRRVIP